MAYRYGGTIFDAHLPAPKLETRRHKEPIAKCGTTGGYSRHKRRGEPVCDECRDANTAAGRARRARLKANA